MSVFGPNQVEELIVFNSANVASSVVKAKDPNTAAAAGDKFKVLQEEGDVLISQFSDTIDPSKVNNVVVKEFAPAVEKEVTVGAFTDANIVDNSTYILEVRILEDGGSLSSENFAVVSGYYQTGTADTADTVANGLADSVNFNLSHRGGKEVSVTVTSSGADRSIVVAGKPQAAVPGKIDGRPVKFQVNHKIFTVADPISENVNNVDITQTKDPFAGTGTGKYAVNLEWFTKGYKYPHYRETGYPADFSDRVPYFASQDKTYNVVHINYFSDRQSPTVEKQQKVFTALVEKTNLASNGDTNTFLGQLRTVLGTDNVPANLAVA